ncbi:hypothetical protein ACB098_11G130500 [Castanea mollissima]
MANCFLFSKSKSRIPDFQYNPNKDEADKVRNTLLVVATLIAAVTFQAGVNPPGGVWQDYNRENAALWTAIYASQEPDFYVFLVFNTVALSTSVLVIISLTYKFPFHLEVLIATASMLATYASAIFAVTPANYSYQFRFILIAAALPFHKANKKQENLCGKCRSGISEDNYSCRKCGSKISENPVADKA